jgi:hypothetical protein
MTGNRRRALLGGSIAATLLSKSQVSADDFGPDNGWYYADGPIHTYCYGSGMSAAEYDSIEIGMEHLGAYTDINDSKQRTNCFSGIDVISRDVNLGYEGVSSCQQVYWGDPDVCDTFLMDIDFALHVGLPAEWLEQTVCHELGHTVGHEHDTADSADSCMMSGQQPDGLHNIYTSHHKDHINAQY